MAKTPRERERERERESEREIPLCEETREGEGGTNVRDGMRETDMARQVCAAVDAKGVRYCRRNHSLPRLAVNQNAMRWWCSLSRSYSQSVSQSVSLPSRDEVVSVVADLPSMEIQLPQREQRASQALRRYDPGKRDCTPSPIAVLVPPASVALVVMTPDCVTPTRGYWVK